MTEPPRSLPTTVVRLYRRIKYEVHRSVEEENKFYETLAKSVGLAYSAPETRKQEVALVAKALDDRT